MPLGEGARRAGSPLRRMSKRERNCTSWANGRDLTRIFGSECMHHDSGFMVACGSLCHVCRTQDCRTLNSWCSMQVPRCVLQDLPTYQPRHPHPPLPMLGQLLQCQ